MPDLDLSAFRKVAEAANDGAWAVGDENPFGPGEFCVSYDDGDAGDITDYLEGVNACHIATFDPPTVLALLDELETLRALTKPPAVGFSSVGSGPIKGVQLRQVSDG